MDRNDFFQELERLFSDAGKRDETSIRVKAGDLHRLIGGYPGTNHRMPVCCSVMMSVMADGDEIIREPPKGNGASLTIEYQLPRRYITPGDAECPALFCAGNAEGDGNAKEV
jgi:5-methylcytosine-specific restriction protein A